MVMETGDETYPERVKRFEYIMGRLSEKPRPTLDVIGKELGISRQNVWRIKHRGMVKPSGRPRSNEGRRQRLIARLAKWQARRIERLRAGVGVVREDRWIARIEADIKALV